MNTVEELSKIKKHIRFLTYYAIVITLVVITLLVFVTIPKSQKQDTVRNFDEINVKRINVLENDGTQRLVISNTKMSPAPMQYGKPFGTSGDRPGIIFYNSESTECGGLVFAGRKDTLNNTYFASGHLSFDQYNQNQVLYLQYLDDNGERTTGLYIDDWHEKPIFSEFRATYKDTEKLPDSPEKEEKLKQLLHPEGGQPAYAHRLFIGKDASKSAMINLSDTNGNTRMELIVDSLGTAKINFLDDKGNITSSLPKDQ